MGGASVVYPFRCTKAGQVHGSSPGFLLYACAGLAAFFDAAQAGKEGFHPFM